MSSVLLRRDAERQVEMPQNEQEEHKLNCWALFPKAGTDHSPKLQISTVGIHYIHLQMLLICSIYFNFIDEAY